MPTTPLERFLLFAFERAYDAWLDYTPRPGLAPDFADFERWTLWLDLDFADRAAAEHIAAEGEIEAEGPDRFAKLDGRGRTLVWRGHDAAPISCPESFRFVPRKGAHVAA